MNQFIAYFTFSGNCREAMQFYQSCFGGKLYFQTVGDTTESASLPSKVKDYILHATLKNDRLLLMGTDMVADEGLNRGNTMSVLLLCNNEASLKMMYGKLAAAGQATQPVRLRSSGGLFGGLTDKYGNHWLLRFEEDPGDAKLSGSDFFIFQKN